MDIKDSFNLARCLPLNQVLVCIGAQEDSKSNEKQSSRKFSYEGEKIVITGPKFFIIGGKSGGGGIDLLLALGLANSPREALDMLREKFSFPSSAFHAPEVRVETSLSPQFVPSKVPLAVHENFQHVKNWLIYKRGLDSSIVEELFNSGLIFADVNKNSVFLSNNGLGCEIRGTGKSKFSGKRGAKAFFELSPNPCSIYLCAFVESAIDAMSLRQLGFKGRIISTAGALSNNAISLAKCLINFQIKIICAFDNDEAGLHYTKQMQSEISCDVFLPKLKDWNEDLIYMQNG